MEEEFFSPQQFIQLAFDLPDEALAGFGHARDYGD
jgi:hypothetical protein